MKNRYGVINNILTGLDNSFRSPEFYETDEYLQCQDDNEAYRYKLSGGVHVLRTEKEISQSPEYIEWANNQIKKKLEEIDIATIRGLREYVASKPDAPQFAKDHEVEAISEREKLK